MDIDLKVMSDINKSELFASLKVKRNEARVPDLLQDLIIQYIAKNLAIFKNRVENPFKNLPNTLVKKFLMMIKDTRSRTTNRLVPQSDELELVKMLLNPNITEFDALAFNDYSRSNDEVYFRHVLENCPKLTKVGKGSRSIFQRRWQDVPVNDLKTWTNLKHFNMKGFYCSDETIKQIQENCPQLEGMEFYVSPEFFSMTGVESLSKMEHLKYLYMNVAEEGGPEATGAAELLVHSAGRVPNLVKFDFDFMLKCWEFIKLYGDLYPNKNLMIRQLELTELTNEWPACLSVENLTLQGDFSSVLEENIMSLPTSVRELCIDGVIPSVIYTALKKIGPELIKLEFNDLCETPFSDKPIDMYKVLAACPKLETFHFSCGMHVLSKNKSESALLRSDYFKCFKSFSFTNHSEESDKNQTELLNLFRLFLLTSENYDKKLAVGSDAQLAVMLHVLKNSPTCLDKLEKIEMELYKPGIMGTILEVAKLLVLRSPVLEKIKLRIFSFDANGVIRNIKEEFGWFKELVKAVGVRLCCVDMSREAAYDSSYGDFSEMEDNEQQGDDDDSFVTDSEDGDSMPMLTDGEDDEWENAEGPPQQIQCAQN